MPVRSATTWYQSPAHSGTSAAYLLSGDQDAGAAPVPLRGDEMALLRAYRDCTTEDRALLVRTAVRLARLTGSLDPTGLHLVSIIIHRHSVTQREQRDLTTIYR